MSTTSFDGRGTNVEPSFDGREVKEHGSALMGGRKNETGPTAQATSRSCAFRQPAGSVQYFNSPSPVPSCYGATSLWA